MCCDRLSLATSARQLSAMRHFFWMILYIARKGVFESLNHRMVQHDGVRLNSARSPSAGSQKTV